MTVTMASDEVQQISVYGLKKEGMVKMELGGMFAFSCYVEPEDALDLTNQLLAALKYLASRKDADQHPEITPDHQVVAKLRSRLMDHLVIASGQ